MFCSRSKKRCSRRRLWSRNDCNSFTEILRFFSDRPLLMIDSSVTFQMLLVSLLSPDIVVVAAVVGRFSGFEVLAVAAESVFLCLFVDVGFVGLLGSSSTLPATRSGFLWTFEAIDPAGLAAVGSTS